jgi:hypothetical protein
MLGAVLGEEPNWLRCGAGARMVEEAVEVVEEADERPWAKVEMDETVSSGRCWRRRWRKEESDVVRVGGA